ncbi:hypothetical protein NDU88_003230 [Pleurodeles waltl]|uniref:Uncharacterized protein n=1 Tax=Pleurodeles waltl TaxID=8319 RepID=A0AAV7SEW7_PLEWA|nr:hypothetical protein NDU88_003230 [Pleurodeles waltl]
MLTRVAVKKADPCIEEPAADPSTTLGAGAGADDLLGPVTQPFIETLFNKLHKDIEALWGDVARDIKDVKKEVTDLGNRVVMLDTVGDFWEEELESHRGELVALRAESGPAVPQGELREQITLI